MEMVMEMATAAFRGFGRFEGATRVWTFRLIANSRLD